MYGCVDIWMNGCVDEWMYGFPHSVDQALSSRRWPVTLVESTAWHSRPLESSIRGGRGTMGNWDMEEQRECGREGWEGGWMMVHALALPTHLCPISQ